MEAGRLRSAATRPTSGRGSIWRASTAWRPDANGGSMPPRPGQLFEREPGRRKLDVHFCLLPPRIIHDPEGNCHPERDDAPEPVSWLGRATNGLSCGFFGYAAAARQALHSRKSGQRLFSKQHLMASTTSAPAFDQRRPAPLSRLPTMRLLALSTNPDPTGRPRIRQRSYRIRSLLASQVRMQSANGE